MEYIYVQIDKCSDEMIWYWNYVGKIFCVAESKHWGNSWQLKDKENFEYDFYIFKNHCHIVELDENNMDKFISSNMIKI